MGEARWLNTAVTSVPFADSRQELQLYLGGFVSGPPLRPQTRSPRDLSDWLWGQGPPIVPEAHVLTESWPSRKGSTVGPYVTDELVEAIGQEREEDARLVRPHHSAYSRLGESGEPLGACKGVKGIRQSTKNLRGRRVLGWPLRRNRSPRKLPD